MDTIYALATAQGKAGVAIVRVSGANAWSACRSMMTQDIVVSRPVVRNIYGNSGEFLDQAMVLGFRGPHSFTGENIVELHLHGSISVVRAVLDSLGQCDGLRLAEPGEFTRRALENGKLDVARVEGLADLIDAETEAQRKQALRVLSGSLGTRADAWRTKLIRAAALLEATIDFADEDVPVDVSPEVRDLLSDVISELSDEADRTHIAERIRTGFEVAIVGAPNVGKSTLLNALAGRTAAITSEIAGTTRDVIEVRMDLNGIPVTLLDTAGVRETADQIETIGIEMALDRANAADIVVVLSDNPNMMLPDGLENPNVIKRQSKCDAGQAGGISAVTGFGVDDLVSEISQLLQGIAAGAGIATRERHRISFVRAAGYLSTARAVLELGPDSYDISAEEIRSGVRGLDSLIGRVDVESLVDEIFSSFCLGK